MHRVGVPCVVAMWVLAGCHRDASRPSPRCPDEPPSPTTLVRTEGIGGASGLPTGDAIADAMSRVEPRVLHCGPFVGARRAMVSVVFAANCVAIDARAFPPLAGTAQGACVQDAAREARIPTLGRPSLEITWFFDVAPPPPPRPTQPATPAPARPRCGYLDEATGLLVPCFD